MACDRSYQHAHEMNVEVRASIREGLRDDVTNKVRICSRFAPLLPNSDSRLLVSRFFANKIGLLSAIMTIDALLVSSWPAFRPRFAHTDAHLSRIFRPFFAHISLTFLARV